MDNVLILQVDKKLLLDGSVYTQFNHQVGETKEALIKWIGKYYKIAAYELRKDQNDEFPYFTDGGFKYTATTDKWEYTFTAHITKLLK